MGEISGVSSSIINNLDGFFTAQVGGAAIYPIASSGQTQLVSAGSVVANTTVTDEYNRAPAQNHTFVKTAQNQTYNQTMGIKSDGTLWFAGYVSNLADNSYGPFDGVFRQLGTDTDWTDISAGDAKWLAIKGGDIFFLGHGVYYQSGLGNTTNYSTWVQVTSTGDWVQVKLGYRHAWALNSSGHIYSTGYNYNYQTGRGITTGITTTWTRDQNNLTDIVEVSTGSYRNACFRTSNGSIYYTGWNGHNFAGPLITVAGDVNGPTLAMDPAQHYVCAKLGQFAFFGGCHIDDSGYLRHHGRGDNYLRPDGLTGSNQGASCGFQLTSMGSGWTKYAGEVTHGGQQTLGRAIKSGDLYIGGISGRNFQLSYGLYNAVVWQVIRNNINDVDMSDYILAST